MEAKVTQNKPVYIVDGSRTPFLKVRGGPGPFFASDLAVQSGRALLSRLPISPTDLDEVVMGNVFPDAKEMNIARVISLRLGCGKETPAYTVSRNCASGMQALDSAAKDILLGRSHLVLAGGTEAMSKYPLIYSDRMVQWLVKFSRAKGPIPALKAILAFRPGFLSPVYGILLGLTDHVVGLSMGQTAENLAYDFGIDRTTMDQFAVESHLKLLQGKENGRLQEIVPLVDGKGNIYPEDDGIRPESSVEKLAKLRPVFDKSTGNVTAGNSAQVTDGAATMLLASEEAVKKHNLPIMGKVLDFQWSGVDPTRMGLGPVYAMAELLKRNGLSTNQIDRFEINEAFAAQVIACVRAWNSSEFMDKEFGAGTAEKLGELPFDKINRDGGAISIGHPVGASGARLPLHLLHSLQQTGGKLGVASLCIGGGQGGAILIESIAQEEAR